jgi:hypothetical protein
MNEALITLPMRKRDEILLRVLRDRLDNLLPRLMRESGIDMWLILCQEDDHDPVFQTLIPLNTWAPILQMLIFYLPPGGSQVERINLSMTNLGDLYQKPWSGKYFEEQWRLLPEIIRARNPARIGINTGSVQWAAGGLTHNLYLQLCQALSPDLTARLVSAEPLATAWLATLSEEEITLFTSVVNLAHRIIAATYSHNAILPGVTTSTDLEWAYWQQAADLGLEVSFKPFYNIIRQETEKAKYGAEDLVIRPGDLIHCDVGIRYLRLDSDHQEWAYVRKNGESDAPAGLRKLMAEGNRLQDIYMAAFEAGLSGNQLLKRILERARAAGIPNPRVYSHSLGHFLHEPGPLIGLPWEQEKCPGRGDVLLTYDTAYTMELSVRDTIPEWDGQEVNLSLEQDVVFTRQGCRLVDSRQEEFHLI